jgi:hypothetical protein
MFFLLATGIHLIGVQPFCTFNVNTYEMQCNYETHEACITYRERDEMCLPNPNHIR